MNRWWGSADDSAKQSADRNQRAQQRDQRAARGLLQNLNLKSGYHLLIKGSRGMALEKLVEDLKL